MCEIITYTHYYARTNAEYTYYTNKICNALQFNAEYQYEGAIATDEDFADCYRISPIKAVLIG